MSRKSKAKAAAAAPPPPKQQQKPLTPWICGALVLLIAIIYAQVWSHQFVQYDDPSYVAENQHVQHGLTSDSLHWAFTNIYPNWHPLTWITHAIDVSLFGVNAGPMLYANVLLHIASTLALFFFLLKTTRSQWRSAIVAALFAVHPLRVESVAWVSERKDVLCALFFFATLLLYAEWTKSSSKRTYVAALVTFILGFLAKGMIITLPFVLILIDYWPLNRFDLKKNVIEKLPFFLLLVPGIAMTYIPQKASGAVEKLAYYSAAARVQNAVLSYVSYLGKTLWPSRLGIPYPPRLQFELWVVVLAAIALVAITAIAWRARTRHPYLLTGWLWYVGMLVPVIGFVQIGWQSMADRYTYLPGVGLAFALVWLAADIIPDRTAQALAAAAIILALTAVAWQQTSYWSDSETLFRHAIAVTAPNAIAHTNIAAVLQEKGDADGELRELTTAAEIEPSSDTLTKLARAELKAGRRDSAAKHLEQAIRLVPDEESEGLLASVQNNPALAAKHFEKAINSKSDSPSLRNDYGAALATLGRDADALAQYDEALRLNPREYDAHMNKGALLARLNRLDDAIREFSAAAETRSQSVEPRIYLALAMTSQHRLPEALGEVREAIRIDHAQANAFLTNAVHMPEGPRNIDDYATFLENQH